MQGYRLLCRTLLFIGLSAVSSQATRCEADTTGYIPCKKIDIEDETACSQASQGDVKCCYKPTTSGPKCWIDSKKILSKANIYGEDGLANGLKQYTSGKVWDKPTSQELTQFAKSVPGADTKEVKEQLGNVREDFGVTAEKRSLTFAFAVLSGSSFMDSPLFPKCPVHIKYCYRVSCGGAYDQQKEKDPKSCLSDPTCCFDYQLGFLRTLLGEGYMQGTPTCYFGATSNQWKYITKLVRPWNPWYIPFILDAFTTIFDTNAYSVAGQFACSVKGLRKAYPVGSKSELQCALVSGCWDESLPEGSQCFMASSFAQNLLGNLIPSLEKEVYPSLYTNDHSDTKCSSNWFDYGPKAYRRMPCGIGPAPTKLVDKLSWCPLNDCCLNYASLDPQDIALLSLYSNGQNGGGFNMGGGGFNMGGGGGFNTGGLNLGAALGLGLGGQTGAAGMAALMAGGGGGFPGFNMGGGTTPNTLMVSYLLKSADSSKSLSDLFCPYKSIFDGVAQSFFPDLSDFTDGCCKIPDCYHKKKLRHTGYIGWGQWGACSNLCGSGTRTRQCFANNQRVSPLNCGGQASEPCTGQNCPTLPPSIPEWSAWSECSVTCGSGQRSRMCYLNGQQQPDSRCGFGSSTEQCYTGPCPTAPPVFASWTQWSLCSVTCESGYRTRTCTYNGQQVADANCGGSSSQQCYEGPCPTTSPPAPAMWGRWSPQGSCSVTCGGGKRRWTRPCEANGVPTDPSACRGGESAGRAHATCSRQQCPTLSGFWSAWRDSTDCGETCGPNRVKRQSRVCESGDGSPLPDTACVGSSMQVVQCPNVPCSFVYYWTGWKVTSSCRYTGSSGGCTETLTRYCYRKNGSSWMMVQPQSSCGEAYEKEESCAC